MAVSTDITLSVILQHKQLFFDLLDQAEAQDGPGSDEFSIAFYLRKLNELIKRTPKDQKRRIGEALDLSNLQKCGLLDYCEERDDRMLFKPFVLDMIRHLDKTRLKELTDAQLNSLREQLSHARELVVAPSFSWDTGDELYQDTVAVVVSAIRATGSQIRQNIDALQAQSVQLASIVDDANASGASRTQQVEVALSKIFQITERHIKPTLLFLDPNIDWKGRGNDAPMRIIDDLKERFARRGLHKEFDSINRPHLAMLHSAERIALILRSLDSYLRMHDRQRKLYEGIESRYQQLLTRVQSLHDGKAKYRLKSSDPHFRGLTSLSGLKNRKADYAAKLNSPRETGRGYLDEYLRVRLEQYKYRAAKPKTEAQNVLAVDPEEQTRRRRINLIAEVARQITLQSGADVYAQVHEYLNQHLQAYQLPELVDALHFLPGNHRFRLAGRRLSITHGDRTLDYLERQIQDRTE